MAPQCVRDAVVRAKEEWEARESEADSHMPTVGLILRDNLPWIMSNKDFSAEQRQAAVMIAECKTPALGTYVDYCPNCDKVIAVRNRSCNNRNCPGCQYPLQEKWIQLRKNEVIEGTPYFHVILTLPHELNDLVEANSKLLLGNLLRSSSQAVIEMCEDPKRLGAKPGIISVVHTWTQDLRLHYHVHMICSGGGIDPSGKYVSLETLYPEASAATDSINSEGTSDNDASILDLLDELESSSEEATNTDDTKLKKNLSAGFFLPFMALKAKFRGKFMAELRLLYNQNRLRFPSNLDYLNDPYEWAAFCDKLYRLTWVGDITQTFNGNGNAIEYLARYTFRTAISNSRIKEYDGKQVSIAVRNNNEPGKKDIVQLEVHEFIRRYLKHILPKGFTRVRFYGFLANGQKKKKLEMIHQQLKGESYRPSPFAKLSPIATLQMLCPDRHIGTCPCCKMPLQVFRFDRDYNLITIASMPRAAPALDAA